jgi:hypothetical protein
VRRSLAVDGNAFTGASWLAPGKERSRAAGEQRELMAPERLVLLQYLVQP